MLKNSTHRYGWVSIALHWSMALSIFAMFGLGLWMRSLSYYDPWYRQGPFIHKSIGILLLALLVFRLLWRWFNPRPADAPGMARGESAAAHLVHYLLYLLLFALMFSGYLISTADGRSIEVFGWFTVPATLTSLPQQEDLAGLLHEWLAWGLIGLVGLHIAAALKHHFIRNDSTLKKMFGMPNQ